jgi:hypothetical protein
VDSWRTEIICIFPYPGGSWCIFNISLPFPGLCTNRYYQLHMRIGCLMHIKCVPKDESFHENLENKYSSHWNTICEFFSRFMKNWKLFEKNKWAISHNSSLLPLVFCFALLCMVENLIKDASYYWPSSFWKWFCHTSSPWRIRWKKKIWKCLHWGKWKLKGTKKNREHRDSGYS